jgi:ACT domain-containing protein
MAIKQPSELSSMNKKVRLLIAGFPGICKTTLSLSAPKPLLIDVDKGIDRVAAQHRQPFIQPENYEEILEDLTAENLKDYETLVFDTGGQLLKLMAEWAKRQNTANVQRDGSLSLKGYGVVGREFENLMNKAYYELNKHVVVVFHAKEEKEGDVFKLRILVEGQTRDNVWQPMDLGGFIEIQNNKRVITFANTERHFGKCCHGIPPSIAIPTLNENSPNNFLTWLFAQVNENIRQEADRVEQIKAEYADVIVEIADIIGSISDSQTAKKAGERLKKVKHKLTSLSESQIMFRRKLEELNLKYDKGTGDYIVKTESVSNIA